MARNEQPILVMNDEEDTSCASCNQHRGIPQGEGSHGICEPHAELAYMRYKVSKVPSAVNEQASEQRRRSLFQ